MKEFLYKTKNMTMGILDCLELTKKNLVKEHINCSMYFLFCFQDKIV